VLLVAVLILLIGQACWAGAVVDVNSEATITGPEIVLGDLAVISSDNVEQRRLLENLKLGSAPFPGNRVLFTAQSFGARLAGTGLDISNVEWHIPATINIVTAGQNISADGILNVAIKAMKKKLGILDDKENDRIIITAISNPQALIAPLGPVEYKVEIPYGIRYNAPTTVNISINIKDRYFTTVNAKFQINAYENVISAGRNIAAFEVLNENSICVERRDLGRLTGYITDKTKVLGLMTRRPIAAGTPLNDSMLAKPPVVTRGSAVTIIVRSGDSIITASGMALQQGSEGEVIRVQNLDSKRVVSACVVDKETVQVMIYSGR